MSLLFPKCCSKISYFLLLFPTYFLLFQAFCYFQFFHSAVGTLFFLSCWNNLLILYCSILWSHLLILVASTCILCSSSSRITFDPFFLTLHLCSICISFFLISPRFFHSKMWISFHNSCIDCCILLFHQGFFTAFPILWLGLRPTFLPTQMAHALINLLVSVIL